MTLLDEEKKLPTVRPEVEYEPSSRHYATRRQFRWLLILLLLNFAVTIQTAYWPGLSATIRTEFNQWRERGRARALQQQAMNWTEPANKVVWDEDPQTAESLLMQPSYRTIRVERLQYNPGLRNWPRGARAVVPLAIQQFYRDRFSPTYHHPFPGLGGQQSVEEDENALILMHNFKTGGGEDRLVYVYVQGKLDLSWTLLPGMNGVMETQPQPVNLQQPFSSTVTQELRIVARPCIITDETRVPQVVLEDAALLLIHPPENRGVQKWSWTPPTGDKPEKITLSGDFFRFYAGQLDPADPTHFTIPYELNNKKGVIHGYLKSNGQLELKPDLGKVVGSNWYPQH